MLTAKERTTMTRYARQTILAVAALGWVACSEIPTDSSGNDLFGVTDDMDPNPPDMSVGGGGDGGSMFNLDLESCVSNSKQTEVLPLDILIALDTSYSMDFDAKWPSVKTALKSFAKSQKSAGISLGLQYFPLRKQCKVDDYASPAVILGELPTNEPAITSSLDAQLMSGGTPMVPLLQGAYAYLKDYQAANPKRKVVLVLATDGIPDESCVAVGPDGISNSLQNAVMLATQAQTEQPSLQTFVIGVGTELSALDAVAAGGGTGQAFIVDTASDTQTAFFTALDTIRQAALQCEFEIPEPEEGKLIIYDQVNVSFTTPTGVEYFANVQTADNCAAAGNSGWYYDNVDMPTRVRLCTQACDKVRLTQNSRIDVIFGCGTIIP